MTGLNNSHRKTNNCDSSSRNFFLFSIVIWEQRFPKFTCITLLAATRATWLHIHVHVKSDQFSFCSPRGVTPLLQCLQYKATVIPKCLYFILIDAWEPGYHFLIDCLKENPQTMTSWWSLCWIYQNSIDLIYINSRLIHLNVTLISLGLWQVVTSSWVENSHAPTAPSHADIDACSDGMS